MLDQSLDHIKERWVEGFIEKGGFKVIVGMLQNSVAKCKAEGSIPSGQIEKDLWNLLIKIVRTLLTAAQLARISEPDLVVTLSRKVSQSASYPEESKGGEGEARRPVNARLIDIMTVFGGAMLEGFDLKVLLDLILEIIAIFLSRPDDLGYDDRFIIEQCVNIWISSVIDD